MKHEEENNMRKDRTNTLARFPNLAEGTPVYSHDDKKLGKVNSLSDDYFIIEKGLFFPKDFVARYDDIQDVRDGSIYLSLTKAELDAWQSESYAGWGQTEDLNTGRLQ